MTALRAALGAVAGGLEGAQQAEALRRKQKLEEEAATRQSAMDQIALADKGFVERGAREGLVRQATPVIGNALRTATAAMSGNLADARPVDFSALGKAAGMYGDTPAASVALGGKTFERMQTPMQASLMAAEQEATQARGLRQEVAKEEAQKASAAAQAKSAERENQIKTYKDLGYSTKEATMMTDNSSAFTTMRGQDISAATARAALEAATNRAGGQTPQGTEDGSVILPSITEALDNFRKITPDQLRKISPTGVSAASQGQQQGGFAELGVTGAGTLLGVIGDSEKRYAQQAGAIADAVARMSEVGVLTNFDVNRFRSQIIFSPGDSETLKREKLNRAIMWGDWMASNKKNVESGQRGKITATPESLTRYQIEKRKDGESLEAYTARTGGR